MEPNIERVESQDAWIIDSEAVRLALTRTGGMIAPAWFSFQSGRSVQPYYLTPWQNEGRTLDDPVLRPLRGDFFCMPFGANNAYGGESHNVHGEPATREWNAVGYEKSDGVTRFEAEMRTSERPGTVRKNITLKDSEPVIYSEHVLEGYEGPMTLGHHAILDPKEESGGLRISTSPFGFGVSRRFPELHNEGGEYASIASETLFDDLRNVPTIWKEPAHTDCTVFPARPGYCDIIQIFADRSKSEMERPAWIAAVAPGERYVWFTLKNRAELPATVFWMENRGRHAEPWNGRTCCIGLEDVFAYAAEGLAPSAADNLAKQNGYPTTVELSPNEPATVRYIQGVAEVPDGFDRVADIDIGEKAIELRAVSGDRVSVPVRPGFVFDGQV